jgi:hypothetical protein
MRKLLVLPLIVAASACQQTVVVPTTNELMGNPQLLAQWQAKCDSGEYSHLPADQKNNFCFTTQEAARSVAIKKVNGV